MRLTYFNNCVNWQADKVDSEDGLCAMIDTGREVSLATFKKLVNKDDLVNLTQTLGYAAHKSQGLLLKDDYHVSYYTGNLAGTRVAWMVHSAIEYVFTPSTFSYQG